MLYRRTTKIIHLFNDRQPENPNPIFRLPFARHTHHDPTQNHLHRHGRILRISRTARTTPAARQARGGGLGWRALGDLRRVLRSPQIRLALGNGGGDSETALPARHFYPAAVRALSPSLSANPPDFQAETFAKPQWQPET